MNRDVCKHFNPIDLPCDKCKSANVQKSTLREAAQQALEAMHCAVPTGKITLADWMKANRDLEAALGCDHCNHPMYAAVKCRVCGRDTPIIEPEIKGNKESAPCNKSCAPGYCYCEFPHGVTDGNCKECYEANAEPVQEPVAWRWGYRSVTTGEMDWRGYVDMAAHPNLRSPEIIMEPLYSAPPQRKPLTEEEIMQCFDEAVADYVDVSDAEMVDFARAIERAHGIGGQP